MPKLIKINPYSEKSVDNAIKQMKLFKAEVQLKTRQLVERLADAGFQIVSASGASEGDTNFVGDAYVQFEYADVSAKATLVLHGEGVAFIEFGAGVHFNAPAGQSTNPFGQQLGLTIGSYGLGLGANDSWVYFDSDEGKYKTSHGTKASMPMATADVAIRDSFERVAREVFV